MNNKTAILNAVQCARTANRMAIFYTGEARFFASNSDALRATYWLDRRATHMATARQLKQDAQQ